MPELFNLNWRDFPLSVSDAFNGIKDEEDLCDVTLVCDDGEVDAHKLVLYTGSLFFKTVLKKSKHPHPLLYLKGVRIKHVQTVLDFLYKGQVNVAQDDLVEFMDTAVDLKINGLADQEVAIPGSRLSISQLRNGRGEVIWTAKQVEDMAAEKDNTNMESDGADVAVEAEPSTGQVPTKLVMPKKGNADTDVKDVRNITITPNATPNNLKIGTTHIRLRRISSTPKAVSELENDQPELRSEKRSERYQRLCKKRKLEEESEQENAGGKKYQVESEPANTGTRKLEEDVGDTLKKCQVESKKVTSGTREIAEESEPVNKDIKDCTEESDPSNTNTVLIKLQVDDDDVNKSLAESEPVNTERGGGDEKYASVDGAESQKPQEESEPVDAIITKYKNLSEPTNDGTNNLQPESEQPVSAGVGLDMESIMRGFYKESGLASNMEERNKLNEEAKATSEALESEVLNLLEKVNDAAETHGWAWSCKVCEKRNYDKHKMRKHVRVHHVNKDRTNLINNEREKPILVSKEKQNKYDGRSIVEDPEMLNMMQKNYDSSGKLTWTCKKCDKTSSERRQLRKHVKAEHMASPGLDKPAENSTVDDIIGINGLTETLDESTISSEVSFVDVDKIETADEGGTDETGDSYAKNLAKILGLMERVTELDGAQAWSCKECKKTSSDKTSIRNHVETHISGLYYECPLCPLRKLNTKKALDIHLDRFHYDK